jgi:uncharacterized SAM-binding protein YcdF (DUF218 family)
MFFLVSKMAGWLITPLNVLIVLQLIGLLLLWTRRRRGGLWVMAGVTASFLAITFTPLPDLALHPLEHRIARPEHLPDKLDGILLLGSAQATDLTAAYGTPHMNSDAETITAFVALARRYPDAKRVFSGGSGRLFPGKMSESAVMQLFFKEQGLDPASLVVEDQSRNTHENMLFTQSLVHPRPGETWMLVTAASHMPRSAAVFRKAGWEVIPYPVAYRTLPEISWKAFPDAVDQFEKLHLAVHEWIGLAAYRITRRI